MVASEHTHQVLSVRKRVIVCQMLRVVWVFRILDTMFRKET